MIDILLEATLNSNLLDQVAKVRCSISCDFAEREKKMPSYIIIVDSLSTDQQRGGGSSVFEPLVRGGTFNFQLPHRGRSSCFFLWGLAHI